MIQLELRGSGIGRVRLKVETRRPRACENQSNGERISFSDSFFETGRISTRFQTHGMAHRIAQPPLPSLMKASSSLSSPSTFAHSLA